MKRLLTTFLVAGLLITTALSLSSCAKKDTTENAAEWIPTVFDPVPAKDGDLWINCDYCTEPVYLCTHGYEAWPNGPLCYEHYHFHCFSATEDCCPPGTPPNSYYCRYRYVRKHQHVVSFSVNWPHHNDNHVGGGTCP